MKILHLSAYDCSGAGTAAYRLHKSLAACGITSKMLVLSKYTEDADVIALARLNIISRAYRFGSRAILKIRSNPDYFFQNQARSALNSRIDYFDEIDFYPDIIVAHWISNFVSLADLYQLSYRKNIPVIWYMMDMAPLTGGCHYAWDCVGYMNQCGKCPALYSSNTRDMSSRNWRDKDDYIKRMNITLVPASGWQVNQAGKASFFNGKVNEKIMLGIDASVFKPCARADARKILNLPANKKILFAGSLSMKQKRKGMSYFLEAVRILEKDEDCIDDILILTAGDITAKKSLRGIEFEHVHLGFLSESRLVTAYQAADVFVCPSVEDSGPVMINQSIMCGTPVVSFEMGVSVDLVHTDVTGYRAILMDSSDLAKGISRVLNMNLTAAGKMSSACREIGMRLTTDEVQVNAFMRLFDEIRGENQA